MSFHCYLSEEINETDSEVQILNVVVRQNVEKESNELEKVEAFFESLAGSSRETIVVFFGTFRARQTEWCECWN